VAPRQPRRSAQCSEPFSFSELCILEIRDRDVPTIYIYIEIEEGRILSASRGISQLGTIVPGLSHISHSQDNNYIHTYIIFTYLPHCALCHGWRDVFCLLYLAIFFSHYCALCTAVVCPAAAAGAHDGPPDSLTEKKTAAAAPAVLPRLFVVCLPPAALVTCHRLRCRPLLALYNLSIYRYRSLPPGRNP